MFICSSIVNKRSATAFHQNDIVLKRLEVARSVSKEKTYCITISLISLSILYHIQSFLNYFARIKPDSYMWGKRQKERERDRERDREAGETKRQRDRERRTERETERSNFVKGTCVLSPSGEISKLQPPTLLVTPLCPL